MEERNIFRNLSPLDHRYYLTNRDLFEKLSDYISEQASISYCVAAEASLLKAYVKRFFNGNPDYLTAIDALQTSIEPEEVYAEEEKTQHNIRALVNVIKRKLPHELIPFVHLGATSVDILDTALSMRMRD
ncbi:MAG TPA: adenylosuccinate lyase, partial [Spirochaetia bacterium]|nr:adenylosuccinate lyase [Spirochaetia bacterium]